MVVSHVSIPSLSVSIAVEYQKNSQKIVNFHQRTWPIDASSAFYDSQNVFKLKIEKKIIKNSRCTFGRDKKSKFERKKEIL